MSTPPLEGPSDETSPATAGRDAVVCDPGPDVVVDWVESMDPRFDTSGVVNVEDYQALVNEDIVNALPHLPHYAVPDALKDTRKRVMILSIATNGGNITLAARTARIHRGTHNYWKGCDPVYAAAYEDAVEAAGEYIEAEAHRRAFEGWIEPIFGKEGMIGVKRKFSDQLLAMRMRALIPERYGEKYSPMNVAVTVDVRTQVELRDAARDRVLAHARQIELAAMPPDSYVDVDGDVVDAEIVDDDRD